MRNRSDASDRTHRFRVIVTVCVAMTLSGCVATGVEMARFAGATGNYDAMLTQCRAMLNSPEERVEARRCIADAYYGKGEKAAAVDSYLEYLELAPQDHETRLRLAHLYLSDKDLKNARRQADIVIRESPRSAKAHYYRGLADFYGGACGRAELAFSEALRLDPELRMAQMRMQTMDAGACKPKRYRSIARVKKRARPRARSTRPTRQQAPVAAPSVSKTADTGKLALMPGGTSGSTEANSSPPPDAKP